jgi:predicted nucleic-acid-binding protein
MTGLDTNVVVRYIMQDDAKQSAKVAALIESLTAEAPGFVSLVSVVELGWVLSSSYGLTREQVAQAIDLLLMAKQVVVDRAEQVLSALRVFKAGSADFADCLIERAAASAGCDRTMTFDVAAAKTARMTLLR